MLFEIFISCFIEVSSFRNLWSLYLSLSFEDVMIGKGMWISDIMIGCGALDVIAPLLFDEHDEAFVVCFPFFIPSSFQSASCIASELQYTKSDSLIWPVSKTKEARVSHGYLRPYPCLFFWVKWWFFLHYSEREWYNSEKRTWNSEKDRERASGVSLSAPQIISCSTCKKSSLFTNTSRCWP